MEIKYLAGTTVFAKVIPTRKLTVRRYAKRIYYCTVPVNTLDRDQVYYERELMKNEYDATIN